MPSPSFPLSVTAPVAYRTVTGLSTESSPVLWSDDRGSGQSTVERIASSMSGARISFDVDLSSSSIKVTLSDRNSGEVYRELVYDRGGLLHLPDQRATGQWIDRSV